MIGIRAHLLRKQVMLVRSQTLDRFEDWLICGFGFQNDFFSFGAFDLRTNQVRSTRPGPIRSRRSSGQPLHLIHSWTRFLNECWLAANVRRKRLSLDRTSELIQ
jgi:hypothetical protein